MWILKYFICLISRNHVWVGSSMKYCLRCGKVETERAYKVVP